MRCRWRSRPSRNDFPKRAAGPPLRSRPDRLHGPGPPVGAIRGDRERHRRLSAGVRRLPRRPQPRRRRFREAAPPADFEAWSNLFDGFRASRDRGFAYAVVCACGGRWVEGRDVGEWLDAALAAAGLRSAASITASALARMRTDVVVDEGDSLGRAERYLLSLGERALSDATPFLEARRRP